MGIGKWSVEKDHKQRVYFIYRNDKVLAAASYGDPNGLDDTEEEVDRGMQELMDLFHLGRPYLEAMNPTLEGF